MLKKTITYTDYNGVERTEDFYFNFNEAELAEMDLSTPGGMKGMVERIVSTQDLPALHAIFKDIIMRGYGEKSPDGKRFIKVDRDGYRLAEDFVQTEAYNKLVLELLGDADAAAKFINGMIPAALLEQAKKQQN